MKVLVVSFMLDPQFGGGAATSALRLCEGLSRQGVEVIALTTHREPVMSVVRAGGFKTYAFRPRNLYWIGDKDAQPVWKKPLWQLIDTWNPHTYRFVRRVIRQEQPDVVHVQKLRGLSPSVWAAARSERARLIVQTCRDYELISPEGLLESRVGRMALERHWTLRPYQVARARWSNSVDVVTAPSDFTLRTITDAGFFDSALQFVVPNTHGLSGDELTRLADSVTEHVPDRSAGLNLLYMGRVEREKGAELACRAFAGIAAELPGARLDVAGSGTLLEELRASYANTPQIRFHGHLTGTAKEALVGQAHALVMPSIVHEVFGNSIIEAYAYGKPVIVSRIGGMPEIVREGQTGFLVEPDDVESLQLTLRRLYAERAELHEMSRACLSAARAYSLEAVTAAYVAAYEAGLTRGQKPSIDIGPDHFRTQPEKSIQ